MLGSLILYLKGMRTTMFQLSGFYYISIRNPQRTQTSQEGRGGESGTSDPEGPYTLFMELGPKKTIPILVLGT